jgi:hypothetical protein
MVYMACVRLFGWWSAHDLLLLIGPIDRFIGAQCAIQAHVLKG